MTAKAKKKTVTKKPAKAASAGASERDMTTFSIRFSEEQRDLIAQAAKHRGWTATNFLRTTALERAVQILNTSEPTNFNFKGLASQIANQLFGARTVFVTDAPGIKRRIDPDEAGIEVLPEELDQGDLMKLQLASEYAGSEFLDMVADFAEGNFTEGKDLLPRPINPNSVLSS